MSKADDLIKDELGVLLSSQDHDNTLNGVFDILYVQRVTPTEIRNRVIIQQYDLMRKMNKKKVYGIYLDLSEVFNISPRHIERIVLARNK